ncbi:hypothetical protein DUI87_24862 [Hirundo rustica rustica]|uniref:Uncharacterized protein n=1 Tax=Hirundo rustica rustica TaxID=333673 RepID=A0A3M0JCE6_HIRRU|nr:hypothetical protein DUI87_24862 [Hirundo rustica rustica]
MLQPVEECCGPQRDAAAHEGMLPVPGSKLPWLQDFQLVLSFTITKCSIHHICAVRDTFSKSKTTAEVIAFSWPLNFQRAQLTGNSLWKMAYGHRVNTCTSVIVTLQKKSQGTISLSCRLIATILSLLILYDSYGDSSGICLPVPHCSGEHKGHQQHPSLAQLFLEGLFIFFPWFLGHKEESQADFSLLSSPYFCSTASLQALNLPVAQATPATVSVSGTVWSTGSSGFYLQNIEAPEQNYIRKHLHKLRLQMSKSKAPKQQRGPERSLLFFLAAMADIGQNITTALLDNLKVLETGGKDGPFHGTDFLMRSLAGL